MFAYRNPRFEALGQQIVAFLRDLFGERVLKTNLILVVTNVINSKLAEKERKRLNKSLDDIIDDLRLKVQTAFGLEQGLVAIGIDTMPVCIAAHWSIMSMLLTEDCKHTAMPAWRVMMSHTAAQLPALSNLRCW